MIDAVTVTRTHKEQPIRVVFEPDDSGNGKSAMDLAQLIKSEDLAAAHAASLDSAPVASADFASKTVEELTRRVAARRDEAKREKQIEHIAGPPVLSARGVDYKEEVARIQEEQRFEAETLKVQPLRVPVNTSPEYQVVFERPNGDMVECRYHDVVLEDGFMTLVYDHSSAGHFLYRPAQSREGEEPTAVKITGPKGEVILLAYSLGYRLRHRNFEYIAFAVEDASD